MMRAALVLTLLVAGWVPPQNTQTLPRITEAQARAALAAAARTSRDAGDVRKACEKELRRIAPTFSATTHDLIDIAGEHIYVIGPAASLCIWGGDAVRKQEPLDEVEWFHGIRVVIQPRMITTDQIVKVVVTRDGQPVQPLDSTLKSVDASTLMGATGTVMAGWVLFPREAFDPGARVVVTAIPDLARRNISREFYQSDLRKIF